MSRIACQTYRVRDVLTEVTKGVGPTWQQYRVVGATRDGIAPAKAAIGKTPERYKPVHPGTVFYNPMRILIGSIAMIGQGEASGITSPDYVVVRAVEDKLDPGYFYYWLRSSYGEHFIKSHARGAVRERLTFARLADAEVQLPPIAWQRRFAATMAAAAVASRPPQMSSESARLLLGESVAQEIGPTWPWLPLKTLLAEPLRTGVSKSAGPSASKWCLTLSAIRDGGIDFTAAKPTDLTDREAENNWVRREDIYIVRGNGNKSLVARGGFAPAVLPREVLFPDLLIQAVFNEQIVDPQFVRFVWDSPIVRADLEARSQTAAGIYKINLRNLGEVLVTVPPLEEQRRLVARWQQIVTHARTIAAGIDEQAKALASLPARLLFEVYEDRLEPAA